MTAEQCNHIDEDFLAEERRTLGADMFAQEYGCEFLAGTGKVFANDVLEDMWIRAGDSSVGWRPAREDIFVSAAG